MQSLPPTIRIAGSDARPLASSDAVALACGIDGCPANCCTNGPPIVLNPYEIARICEAGRLSYEDLLDIVETDRDRGFPLVMLPRDPQCHFWSGRGCAIYQARPLACRLFPLGRVFDRGASHIVLPERNKCGGLLPTPARTVAHYLEEQEAGTFLAMSDRWIEFVTGMEQHNLPDKPVISVGFHMFVYSPDTPPALGRFSPDMTTEDRFTYRLAAAQETMDAFLSKYASS